MNISEKIARVDGLNIHYLAAGEGDPVVLLHGTPAYSYLWRKIIPPLARNLLVIAPDLPGFGRSDKPLGAPYTIDYYATVLDGFFRILGIERTALVVHDLGGPAGLLWAARNPGKVTRLAIMETGIHREKMPFWLRLSFLAAFVPGLRDLLVSPAGLAATLKLAVVNKQVMTRETIAAYQAPFATAEARHVLLKTTQTLYKTMTASGPNELDEMAEKISTLKLPVHLIYGRGGVEMGVAAQMSGLQRVFPDARLTVIPQCGHFVQEDQPEMLSELLVEFLV